MILVPEAITSLHNVKGGTTTTTSTRKTTATLVCSFKGAIKAAAATSPRGE